VGKDSVSEAFISPFKNLSAAWVAGLPGCWHEGAKLTLSDINADRVAALAQPIELGAETATPDAVMGTAPGGIQPQCA
jgi:hypothetical protein